MAVTVNAVPLPGAVNSPAGVIVPAVALQVNVGCVGHRLVELVESLAVNCCVAPLQHGGRVRRHDNAASPFGSPQPRGQTRAGHAGHIAGQIVAAGQAEGGRSNAPAGGETRRRGPLRRSSVDQLRAGGVAKALPNWSMNVGTASCRVVPETVTGVVEAFRRAVIVWATVMETLLLTEALPAPA